MTVHQPNTGNTAMTILGSGCNGTEVLEDLVEVYVEMSTKPIIEQAHEKNRNRNTVSVPGPCEEWISDCHLQSLHPCAL